MGLASQVGGGLSQPTFAQTVVAGAAMGFVVSTLLDLAALPFLLYSQCVLERRYRASRAGVARWLWGYGWAMGIHALVWLPSAATLYAIIWLWPNTWWVVIGISFAVVTIGVTHFGPVVVLPRLYDLRPLARPDLQARLDALTQHVGVPVVAIQEWRLGSDPSRPNAALVGLGSTRRVLLSDALLADYSDDEIEVVLAHELAHHLHNDIWKTIGYEAVVAVVACGVAHLAIGWAGAAVGLGGVRDVGGLPLLTTVAGGVVLLLAPIRQGMSRRHEFQADRYALRMTRNPEALASSLRRLAEQTLAEERPSRLVQWLFYSHPPTADRLAAARAAMDDFQP